MTEVAMFFPAYQEGDNLPNVVGRAVKKLEHMYGDRYKVIIVDDGSADPTAKKRSDNGYTARVASELSRQYKQVEVVTHTINLGYGAAFRTGCKAALDTGANYIAFCDADGQFDPAEVEKLIVHARHTGEDLVIGYRMKRADSRLRWLTGRGWHFTSRMLLNFGNITDVDCGFKLFTREALSVLYPQLKGDHAVISPEILARAKGKGFRVGEVAVSHRPRQHGQQSGLDWHVVSGSYGQIWEIGRDIKRLKQLDKQKEMAA